MIYRLVSADGADLDGGEAVIEMVGDTLHVSPAIGTPYRLAPSDIAAVTEIEPYAIALTLVEGPTLQLHRLGAMRTQILAELTDARGRETVETLLLAGVGTPEIFPGYAGDLEAEIRLYDDALVVTPIAGDGEKIPYAFVTGVSVDGYRISVDAAGRDSLLLHRLARRTTEFAGLLTERHRRAASRTSQFLGALLPGLGPVALRQVAARLRDGVAARAADLDAIEPTVSAALLGAATRPDRAPGLSELAVVGQLWIGFKQLTSVERPAEGVTAWSDSAITPTFDHHAGGSAFGSGVSGMMGAAMMAGGPPRDMGFDGPFASMGPMLAMSMLGGFGGAGFGGSGFGGQGFGGSGFGGGGHVMKPRANVERGNLTPAHTDYDALTATGEEPTILAFALCVTESGRVIYESLNRDDDTLVFAAPGGDRVMALNRALDQIGFDVAAVATAARPGTDDVTPAGGAGDKHAKAARLPALRPLREDALGAVAHGDTWADSLRALI